VFCGNFYDAFEKKEVFRAFALRERGEGEGECHYLLVMGRLSRGKKREEGARSICHSSERRERSQRRSRHPSTLQRRDKAGSVRNNRSRGESSFVPVPRKRGRGRKTKRGGGRHASQAPREKKRKLLPLHIVDGKEEGRGTIRA